MMETYLADEPMSTAGGRRGAAGAITLGTTGISFAGSRPELTHGVQSGDVSDRGAVVWTRADRASQMRVEFTKRPDFKHARAITGPALTEATDFTGKLRLEDLEPGKTYHYRITAEADHSSAPLEGSFTTASDEPADIRFQWSGDLAGQGWGINPDLGGYRIFDTMAASEPDFFLCSGDFIYADNPIAETVTQPDGTIWRNVTTEGKSKVAETLQEFRAQFQYNFIDDNLRAYLAKVPMVNQWDDHEVVNNWYPGEILDLPEYTEKRVDVLAARARQAFLEYTPGGFGPGPTAASTARSRTGRSWTCSCSTRVPSRTPTAPTTPPPAACSSATSSASGSNANSPHRRPLGRSSPPTSRSA